MDQHSSSRIAGIGTAPRRRRSSLREERHPNSVTAPPIHRGSMAPRPWRGFWPGVASALLTRRRGGVPVGPTGQPAPVVPEEWELAARRRRMVFAVLTLLSTAAASWLFASAQPDYGNVWLEFGQIALFAILSTWVVTGFVTALMGFYVSLRGDSHALSAAQVRHHALDARTRTAIIMPICNEDVATVFAGLRATCESVAATGHAGAFDVFVLSDSSDPAVAAAERKAWEELRIALAANPQQPQIEVYYRLRQRRTHRKSGNVADFCRRWGRDYQYMIVLDADSVMSGDCILSMVKLMETHPRAGIIQTATQAIGHATLHARAQQFASRVTGRLFTLGMQFWQLGESHYWGHNAIIRVQPFMQHCALAPISGQGGMAGPIMSHDFVEAALMRRAGYQVWLVSDLTGSYEQQPPDLLSELQRDRRWCHGNLQNSRLIAEPGLHPVHRAMFAIGAMSYLSAPLWLAFMTFGTVLWMSGTAVVLDWHALPAELRSLWAWTLCMLFMPRLLGLAAVFLQHDEPGYGGAGALLRSAAAETVLALLQAPVRMLAHSLFVLVALTGLQLDWKSPPRHAAGVTWREAATRLLPM
ncbi:MAG: glucans biosynthesis glucosyltransferase MdoH, partial [Ramlibacter sp.]